jgi:uncharacterized membrane-anchored protein
MAKTVLTLKNDLHDSLKRTRITAQQLPVRVHVLAYKNQLKDRLLSQILPALGIEQKAPLAESLTFFPQGFIKTASQDSYFTVAIWQKKTKQLDFGLTNLYKLSLNLPITDKLTELEILVIKEKLSKKEINKLFHNQIVYGSYVSDNFAQVYTSFQPDTYGRERYLVIVVDSKAIDKLELVIDLIIQLENSFHLLYEPTKDVLNLMTKLKLIEAKGATVLNEVNAQLEQANTEKLKKWLQAVTKDYAALANIHDSLNLKLSNAISLKNNLKDIFTELKETPILKTTETSKPLMTLALRKTADYAKVLTQVQTARNRRLDVIKILRTRLDILEREQAFALQCSMHETTKTQMALQKSVEGLYVFIVAFYLTELARIVFEALKAKHLIQQEPVILAAFFIPFALLLALALAGKLKFKKA